VFVNPFKKSHLIVRKAFNRAGLYQGKPSEVVEHIAAVIFVAVIPTPILPSYF